MKELLLKQPMQLLQAKSYDIYISHFGEDWDRDKRDTKKREKK